MAATERCRRRHRTCPRCGNSPLQLYRYFFLAFRLGVFLRLRRFAPCLFVRRHKLNRTYAKPACKVEQHDNRRVSQTAFEIADILLGRARPFGETLLSEALRPPQSR